MYMHLEKNRPPKRDRSITAKTRSGKTQAGPKARTGDNAEYDTSRLLHELGIHQIELEMQNKELRKAHDRLEAKVEERTFELAGNNARFAAIFNSITDAIIFADTKRHIALANPAVTRIFGYQPEELLGRTAEIIYADKEDFREQGRLRYTVTGAALPDIFEMRYRRKDGSIFIGESLAVQVRDSGGMVIGFVGIHRDITARKEFEEELRLTRDRLEIKVRERTFELSHANAELKAEIAQRLSAEDELLLSQQKLRGLYTHFQTIREEERNDIAREIHDELGQIMTAIKMDLSWIRDRIPKELYELVERTNSNVELVDRTIQTIKRIITELRPGILDHLGLGAAIEWQALEFQKKTGIACDVTIYPPDIIVEPAISIALFRIFQESLTNVARHAKAASLNASLRKGDNKLKLEVADDGIGIAEEKLSQSKSFGIMGMRERVYQFNGEINITGTPGRGTVLSVMIPLTEHGRSC
jgi:PAS domain S-box-containing protein